MLEAAESVDAFRAAPRGRYVRGESWLYACVDERLFMQIYWGKPTRDDVERLTVAWQAELMPSVARHAALVDASDLDGMDPQWFALIAREMAKNGAALTAKLERQALVRPAGVAGMLVSGFYEVVTPTYPVEVFTEMSAALAWLGRAEVSDEISALRGEARRDAELLERLREHIASALTNVTLASAARALALSERTLQRRLRDAKTSFQQMLSNQRVRTAETLIEAGDRKLADIALAVGFSSAQHLTDVFRRIHGIAPSAWRKR